MLESSIEEQVWRYAESRGWWQAKFTSPGLRAVPDRLFIRNGVHIFIEFKKEGEDLRKQQAKRKRDMEEHGATVYGPIDSLEQVRDILR